MATYSSTAKLYTLLSACKPDDIRLEKRRLIEMIKSSSCYTDPHMRYRYLRDNYYSEGILEGCSVNQLKEVVSIMDILDPFFNAIQRVIDYGDVTKLQSCRISDYYSFRSFEESLEKIKKIKIEEKNLTNITIDNLWDLFRDDAVKTSLTHREKNRINTFEDEYTGYYSFNRNNYIHIKETQQKKAAQREVRRRRLVLICLLLIIVTGCVISLFLERAYNLPENVRKRYAQNHDKYVNELNSIHIDDYKIADIPQTSHTDGESFSFYSFYYTKNENLSLFGMDGILKCEYEKEDFNSAKGYLKSMEWEFYKEKIDDVYFECILEICVDAFGNYYEGYENSGEGNYGWGKGTYYGNHDIELEWDTDQGIGEPDELRIKWDPYRLLWSTEKKGYDSSEDSWSDSEDDDEDYSGDEYLDYEDDEDYEDYEEDPEEEKGDEEKEYTGGGRLLPDGE